MGGGLQPAEYDVQVAFQGLEVFLSNFIGVDGFPDRPERDLAVELLDLPKIGFSPRAQVHREQPPSLLLLVISLTLGLIKGLPLFKSNGVVGVIARVPEGLVRDVLDFQGVAALEGR